MKLLLDTNVIIDYLGGKEPQYDAAVKIIASGFFGDNELWASATSYKDAFYVLRKYVDGLRVQEAISVLCGLVKTCAVAADDPVRAANMQWNDYEDAFIALGAQRVKADYIVTSDKKDFSRSAIPAISPTKLLSIMETKDLRYDEVSI